MKEEIKAFNNVLELIGNTPLIKLNKVTENLEGNFYAKVEAFNPGHSTKDRIALYIIEEAEKRGIRVIIAGAGGAAHLPGMVASITPLPVIGVPVKSASLEGMDSLLSIVQMPGGIPVATVAINGAKNAGILAAEILGVKYKEIRPHFSLKR